MKSLIVLTVGLLFSVSVNANVAEKDKAAAKAAQDLLVAYGYRCDTVTSFHRSAWDGAFRLVCNNRYVYEIRDVGGRWQVSVK